MTTSPASASALEPMTVTHTRDLVASILHAHASILHAPAPPLTSAELDEARSIVSQLLDGAGPPVELSHEASDGLPPACSDAMDETPDGGDGQIRAALASGPML